MLPLRWEQMQPGDAAQHVATAGFHRRAKVRAPEWEAGANPAAGTRVLAVPSSLSFPA